jgi:ribosomal protein L16 Arg81 hydroxylase
VGRATASKREQLDYLQKRIRLISEMVQALEEQATSEDLENLAQQIEAYMIKLERFKKDWEVEENAN